MPQGENMKRILSQQIQLDVSRWWDITLPDNIDSLLPREVTRDRVIFLMRRDGKLKDGVAILFPEK